MKKESDIHIGTSGWVYKHWKEIFYPQKLSEKEYLKYYSQHFLTTEVNNSFYHLLREEIVKNWVQSVPENFIFTVKASRFITHMKKLLNPSRTTINFFDSIKPFENKMGPILFQLPPKFSFNFDRLKSFVNVLPQNHRYAFEFRDASWFNNETYNLFSENNIAFCIYNLGGFQSPKEVTSDFIYIRLHGNYGLGSGKYNENQIKNIANDIKTFSKQGLDIYCYFNNDEAGYAIENARMLKQQLNLYP